MPHIQVNDEAFVSTVCQERKQQRMDFPTASLSVSSIAGFIPLDVLQSRPHHDT
jgi:hypothetical protein